MKPKKSKKADLESKRSLFFQTGMIIVLITMILIFDLSWSNAKIAVIRQGREIIDEDIMPIIDIPDQPQEIILPIISDAINIVDESVDITAVFDWNVDNPDFKVIDVGYIEHKKAPKEEPIDEPDIPVALLKDKPKFEGGDANTFSAWINRRIKYPEDAMSNNVDGKVILQFIIDVDGSLTNIKVLNKIDKSLELEAVRIVASSPKWTPGRLNGKTIRTVYEFPVTFKLN